MISSRSRVPSGRRSAIHPATRPSAGSTSCTSHQRMSSRSDRAVDEGPLGAGGNLGDNVIVGLAGRCQVYAACARGWSSARDRRVRARDAEASARSARRASPRGAAAPAPSCRRGGCNRRGDLFDDQGRAVGQGLGQPAVDALSVGQRTRHPPPFHAIGLRRTAGNRQYRVGWRGGHHVVRRLVGDARRAPDVDPIERADTIATLDAAAGWRGRRLRRAGSAGRGRRRSARTRPPSRRWAGRRPGRAPARRAGRPRRCRCRRGPSTRCRPEAPPTRDRRATTGS